MSVELVLNDLSYQPLAENPMLAQQRMLGFAQTLQTATKAGAKRILRTHDDLNGIELAEAYTFRSWLFDHDVKRKYREEQSFVQRLISKAPFLTDHENALSAEDELGRSEFSHAGRSAKGLGVAAVIEAIAISFASDAVWDYHTLQLERSYITDDDVIETSVVSVPHISQPNHVQPHQQWIEQCLRRTVRDGAEAWERRAELFPQLAFCATVEKQLADLHTRPEMWRQVLRHLWELQRYASTWNTRVFDPDQIALSMSGESEVTLGRYSAERTFRCPDGENRVFEWHSKIGLNYWRIHFYPDFTKRQLIIGYVGKHLSTVKFH